ncbi:phosphoesterase RecJ domain-containing protein [Prosthecobacter debontii]|uniref:Phosphoesterase RecJ domain-containing protein n=1 Tax=Prosthecobacter debontii TaxID=48467 RepID=A0A1T4Z0J0_9BACT|nr:bifunctional oligoribonuclease/PAP phosphatase NrnA [Prosthecobacter debontii]SKB07486.1 phosphoesterase RecJ domain-containing protein [Prosthecobacter debontii]
MLTPLSQIAEALRSARSVAIAAHVRPDGDAVGSVMGLALSLQAAGKTVYALLEDGVPSNLTFLPEVATILTPPYADFEIDVAVALDTATHERLGEKTKAALARAPLLIDIDHHPANPGYGQLNHVDGVQPAVGQIVYELLKAGDFPLTDAVLQHLYTAIITDTGSFQFSSTTARTHEIVAEMLKAGLDTARLARLIYQTQPVRRLQLLRAMLNEMDIRSEGRIASWKFTRRLMDEVQVQSGDTEGLIDTLRMIDSVVAAVIFEEMPDGKIRVSSRSKDERLDVSAVCAQFGGGGHRMAAGARMRGPIEAATETFLTALEHEVRRLA